MAADEQVHAAYARALEALPAHLPGPGYEPVGIEALRRVVADRYAAEGMTTTAQQVVVTAGALGGLALLLRAATRPGDRAVLADLRFHLRQGVTFSDGSGFDAQDVKHSFERALSDKISCETPRYFGGMTVQANVVDDHTIDFKADPVQPILPLLMSMVTIVPEETPIEFVRDPIGTGPYKVTEWTPGQRIVLIDDFLGDPTPVLAYLDRAAGLGVRGALLQVLDPDEEAFPYGGAVLFRSAETTAFSLLFDTGKSQSHLGTALLSVERLQISQGGGVTLLIW